MSAPATGSRAATSACIGEKLLLGWTLLAEACPRPGCAAPLLRSPGAGELLCPQHGGLVAPEELAEAAAKGDQDAAAAAAKGHAADAGPDRADGAAAAAAEPRRAAAPEAASPSHTSDALPPYPGAPGAGAAPPHGTLPTPEQQAASISALLLAGWTMTAKPCPVEGCLAPLMRNRLGQLLCPAHKLWVVTPSAALAPASAPVDEEDSESGEALRGVIAAKDAEIEALKAQLRALKGGGGEATP